MTSNYSAISFGQSILDYLWCRENWSLFPLAVTFLITRFKTKRWYYDCPDFQILSFTWNIDFSSSPEYNKKHPIGIDDVLGRFFFWILEIILEMAPEIRFKNFVCFFWCTQVERQLLFQAWFPKQCYLTQFWRQKWDQHSSKVSFECNCTASLYKKKKYLDKTHNSFVPHSELIFLSSNCFMKKYLNRGG